MAKKTLGYVELEWICPSCGGRNKGSEHDCRQCGAEMPDDVSFQLPPEVKLDTSEATARQVAQGPDVLCPWCGARNKATAEICDQCAGPLKEGRRRNAGETVGAFSDAPAPPIACPACGAENPASALTCTQCGAPLVTPREDAPAPKPKPVPQRKWTWAALIFFVVALLFCATMSLLSRGRDQSVATVQQVGWSTTIALEQLVPVEKQAWLDEVPQNLEAYGCTSKIRWTVDEPVEGSIERCGTPYVVDTGTGKGEVRSDCVYDIPDDWCRYEDYVWRAAEPVSSEGFGYTPRWPDVAVGETQREARREQVLFVTLATKDKSYTYRPDSVAEMQQYQPNSRWQITTNALGGITDIQPAE